MSIGTVVKVVGAAAVGLAMGAGFKIGTYAVDKVVENKDDIIKTFENAVDKMQAWAEEVSKPEEKSDKVVRIVVHDTEETPAGS